MKMKWVLKRNEFDAVYAIVEGLLFKESGDEVYDKLLQTLLAKIYKRFYVMRLNSKSKYKISMPEEECLCFYELTVIHGLPNTSFEGNLLNKLIADIDKHFAINASIEIYEKKNYVNHIH